MLMHPEIHPLAWVSKQADALTLELKAPYAGYIHVGLGTGLQHRLGLGNNGKRMEDCFVTSIMANKMPGICECLYDT